MLKKCNFFNMGGVIHPCIRALLALRRLWGDVGHRLRDTSCTIRGRVAQPSGGMGTGGVGPPCPFRLTPAPLTLCNPLRCSAGAATAMQCSTLYTLGVRGPHSLRATHAALTPDVTLRDWLLACAVPSRGTGGARGGCRRGGSYPASPKRRSLSVIAACI